MEIKFKVDAAEFNAALGVVSIVTPQATPQGGGGYLFVVRGETCLVYSRNGGHEARAKFPITDVEGEGPFMYPADHVAAFAYVQGTVSFTATADGESFRVKYTHGGSGVSDHVTFDPRTTSSFEKDIETARAAVETPKTFNIKILQSALGMAKSFMAKPNDSVSNEEYKTIKIFGNSEDPKLAKANGYMFASNGKEAFYFHSTAFLDRGFSAPAQHLPLIEAFLGKSSGTVAIYSTDKKTYLINDRDEVFGWPHHDAEYTGFMYLAKNDEVCVQVSAKSLLYQLQYMKAEISKDRPKIRMHFNPSNKSFWFSSTNETNTTTSIPVEARESESKVTSEIVANVNVNHMIRLFEGVKGDTVELRVRIVAANATRPKEVYMFRSIDEFLLSEDGTIAGGSGIENVPDGVHQCKVTRYAASMD